MESKKLKMDIYKSKRRFALFLYIFSAIFMVGSIVLDTIAFSGETFVAQDKEMSALFYNLSNQNVSRFYLNTVFSSVEKKSAETMFRSVYTKNLSNDGYQHILAVSNKDSIMRASTYFNDVELPFASSITSSLVFSNREDPPCFETLLINLFKYRIRSEEINYDPNKYSGFIYIPDYFADYIIEHNENFSTYSDLFESDNAFSFFINNTRFDYKIANVFCVNGFKKEYCGNVETKVTYDYGKLLNNFLANFCIVSSISSVANVSGDLNLSVVSVLDAKRFLLIDTFKATQDALKKSEDTASVKVFYQNDQNIEYYKNSPSLTNAFLYNKSNISSAFKIFSIIFSAVSVVILMFLFFKFFIEKKFYIFTLYEFAGLLLVLLIFSILKRTSLALSISLFYNSATSFVIVLYLLFLLIILLSAFVGKKKNK